MLFVRIFQWFINKVGLRNILFVSLLMLAVGSMAYGLSEVIKGLEFKFVFQLVFWGILLSWFLAGLDLRNLVGAIALFIVGVLGLLIDIGNILSPLLTLFKVSNQLIWFYLIQEPNISLDLINFNLAYADVYFGIAHVIESIRGWVVSILDGLPIYDEIAIALVWGMATWFLSCWAGWVFRRYKQPFICILPAGVLLAATFSYAWAAAEAIIPMMFATLLLIAMANFDQSENSWIALNMDFPEDLSKEFGLMVVALVIGIVAVASILPIFSIENIIEFAQEFTKPQVEEAKPVIQSFGLKQSSAPREDIGRALSAGFPRGHLIGSGPELAENLVMAVQITGGIRGDPRRNISLPLYWRSLTYDEYTGLGWRSTDIILRSYRAGDQVVSKESPYHQIIQLDIKMAKGDSQYLYAAGDILTADEDFKIAYRPTSRYTEVLAAHGDFFGASIDHSAYRVQSVIPEISEDDLRKAEGNYPDWIVARYLTLPDTIPSRVFQLADILTKDAATPYDKAKVLENYLREFEYTLDVDIPNIRKDMVDYFLFDLQKGYCDYFASSMVVMVRSLGIPARLAIGYSRGTYDNVNNRYIVTEADAHSWVEVYFPQIGWVPFEPTSGHTAIERLELLEGDQESFIPVDQIRPLTPWYSRIMTHWWTAIFYTLVSIIGLFLLYQIIDEFWVRNLPPSKAIDSLYQRLFRYGRRLNAPATKSSTPWEFANVLIFRLDQVIDRALFKKFISVAKIEIFEFTEIYNQMLFSPTPVDFTRQRNMMLLWQRLRFRLWLASIQQINIKPKNPVALEDPIGEVL